MTRKEHLQWAKNRALKYVNKGYIQEAFASLASDLRKHPDTEKHGGIELGMVMFMSGRLSTPEEMMKFINGFN